MSTPSIFVLIIFIVFVLTFVLIIRFFEHLIRKRLLQDSAYCSLGEGLLKGIPYCSFSPFLFLIAVSLCTCHLSKKANDFLNIFLKGSHGSHGFFFVASNGDSHLVSQWKNSEGVGKFVRFERFVFKNQYQLLFLSRTRISRISNYFHPLFPLSKTAYWGDGSSAYLFKKSKIRLFIAVHNYLFLYTPIHAITMTIYHFSHPFENTN